MRERAQSAYRRLEALHREFFVSKWRAGLQQEASRQEDAFLAWVFLEALGIESPASWYALELYPEVLESFHRWHQRMGLRHFPEPGVCC